MKEKYDVPLMAFKPKVSVLNCHYTLLVLYEGYLYQRILSEGTVIVLKMFLLYPAVGSHLASSQECSFSLTLMNVKLVDFRLICGFCSAQCCSLN